MLFPHLFSFLALFSIVLSFHRREYFVKKYKLVPVNVPPAPTSEDITNIASEYSSSILVLNSKNPSNIPVKQFS